MISSSLKYFSLVLILAVWLQQICSGQIVTESFVYTNGTSLTGQTNGTGWLAAWAAAPGTGNITVNSNGLTYATFTNAGGALVDADGSNHANGRKWFNPAANFTNGTTIWFSCLMRYDVNNTSDILVMPLGQSNSATGGYGVAISTKPLANSASGGTNAKIYIRNNGSSYGVGGSSGAGMVGGIGLGKTVFVVGRFTLTTNSNSDALDLWVNQTAPPATNSPLRLTGFTAYRTVANSEGKINIYMGSAAQGAVDELGIGYTYADVTKNLATSAPPVIVMSTSTNETIYASPANVSIAANVTTNGHTIQKVQFINNGSILSETTAAPFRYNWSGLAAGTYTVNTRLVYDGGLAIESAPATVYVFDNSPATFNINAQSNRIPISPLIYGCNWANSNQLSELNYTLNRRGGEVESRYNWQLNVHNLCKDWYFISMADSTGSSPGADADNTVANSFNGGADADVLVPILGWMPKLGANRSSIWSYSVAKYGPQTGHEPYGSPDAGNGVSSTNGNNNITWNDSNDASFFTNSLFQAEYIKHLTNRWGTASNGGVKYYALDNEPYLWDYTHRDVQKTNVIKELVRDRVLEYAPMIKAVDPSAKVLGFEEWGYSDAASYYPWLLAQCQNYQTTNGTRILDYMTLHYYAALSGTEGSLPRTLQRNRSTRTLWDSNYVDESWINSKICLIPTMKNWVATNYPGTKIGITEYNWEGDGNIEGAVMQAEVLGIYGREGLDMATRWGSSANNPTNIIFKAMKIYRNYDGIKSTFGDTSVSTIGTANPDDLSAFAAERSPDKALTVMVMNKLPVGNRTVTLSLSNYVHNGSAQVWQLTSANVISNLPSLTVSGNSLTATLPGWSVTLFVIGSGTPIIAGQAINPIPTNNAAGISATPTLSWKASTNAFYHYVYLGTSSNAVATATTNSPEFAAVTTVTNFNPGALAYLTSFFWRVDEVANSTSTTGSVWRFTTVAAPSLGNISLTNSDAAGNSSFNAKLNWNDTAAPNSGNNYYTAEFTLRTPNNMSDIGFSGASLIVNTNAAGTGGALLFKSSGTGYNVTINNLTLAGGTLNQAQNLTGGTTTFSLNGTNLAVTANSAIKSTPNSGETRALVINSPIRGNRNLLYTNDGGGFFHLTLAGDNSEFSVTNFIGAAIGSSIELRMNLATGSAFGSGPIVLGAGNISIENTAGVNITLANTISGSGGLNITGTDAFLLTGTNTYSGATVVKSGGLFVNGQLGNSLVTVSNNSLLGGNGVFAGPVVVNGSCYPGSGGIGRLTVSNALTLNGLIEFDVNKSASPSNDTVVVTGALAAGGTFSVEDLAGTNAVFAAGDTFVVFSKPVSGSFANYLLPGLSPGLAWQNNLALNGSLSVVALPVGAASSPSPKNGATGAASTPTLSWLSGSNAVGHLVFFGANSNALATATPTSPEFQGNQTETNFSPGQLASSGRFFWRVDEVGVATSTNGAVWSFVTAVNPANKPVIGGDLSGGNLTISIPSELGQTYRIERTDSLAPANWQSVSNNIPGTGAPIKIAENFLLQSAQRFYRVLILPP
ncbi:MAG: glycoside hydrolase family 44 protein [Verrucomicrobiota bacterium]